MRGRIAAFIIGAAMVLGVGFGVVYAGVDDEINDFVGRQNRTYWDNQPAPFYDYSAPRDVVIQLYNTIVPQMHNTWTFFISPGIGVTDWCYSKGVPISAGAQLTSPEYRSTGSSGAVSLPQPEPSGLYTPADTLGTWVLCVNQDGTVSPVYSEDYVRVYYSPHHLDESGKIIADGGPASATVDMSKAGQ